MSVGRNSFKKAMQKAKEKTRRVEASTGAGPSPAPGTTVMERAPDESPKKMTGGGYGITRLNYDRPADSMPTEALNRYNYGVPRMSRNFMEAIESDPNANDGIKAAVAKEKKKQNK